MRHARVSLSRAAELSGRPWVVAVAAHEQLYSWVAGVGTAAQHRFCTALLLPLLLLSARTLASYRHPQRGMAQHKIEGPLASAAPALPGARPAAPRAVACSCHAIPGQPSIASRTQPGQAAQPHPSHPSQPCCLHFSCLPPPAGMMTCIPAPAGNVPVDNAVTGGTTSYTECPDGEYRDAYFVRWV